MEYFFGQIRFTLQQIYVIVNYCDAQSTRSFANSQSVRQTKFKAQNLTQTLCSTYFSIVRIRRALKRMTEKISVVNILSHRWR